jgi:replicative superfamily II helicase
MVARLPDTLNAEIVLGTITNVAEAMEWLTYTYLHVRMCKAPGLYGITVDENDKLFEKPRADFVHTACFLLDKGSLIKYDKKTGLIQVNLQNIIIPEIINLIYTGTRIGPNCLSLLLYLREYGNIQ